VIIYNRISFNLSNENFAPVDIGVTEKKKLKDAPRHLPEDGGLPSRTRKMSVRFTFVAPILWFRSQSKRHLRHERGRRSFPSIKRPKLAASWIIDDGTGASATRYRTVATMH
jgi:hypothetical protein